MITCDSSSVTLTPREKQILALAREQCTGDRSSCECLDCIIVPETFEDRRQRWIALGGSIRDGKMVDIV